MKDYVRSNFQFLTLCSLWVAVGIAAGSIPAVLFISASVLLLKYRNLYHEMFLGFLFVLILSDSRHRGLAFAADAKEFYILLLSMFFFFDSKNFSSINKLVFLFAPFLLISLCLVVISENWVTSFQKTISYVLMLFIAPNYLIKIYEEKGSIFLKNIVFLFVFILLVGFVLKFVNPNIAILNGRYRGVFGNPNGIGLFCTLFFLFYYVIQEYFPDLFSKGEKAFVYAVIILSILLCGSRSTILSIVCFLIFIKLYKISPYVGLLILCTMLVSYELIFQNFELILRYLGLGGFFRIETFTTGSGRNVAWNFAWDHIQDNFFLGKGFAYDELLFYDDDNFTKLSMLGHQGNVHNSYLTIWLNTGIIGLFFFLRGILFGFLKGTKNSRIAFPIMFTVLFSGYFESWISASLNPFTIQLWMILAILISPQFNKKENENSVLIH